MRRKEQTDAQAAVVAEFNKRVRKTTSGELVLQSPTSGEAAQPITVLARGDAQSTSGSEVAQPTITLTYEDIKNLAETSKDPGILFAIAKHAALNKKIKTLLVSNKNTTVAALRVLAVNNLNDQILLSAILKNEKCDAELRKHIEEKSSAKKEVAAVSAPVATVSAASKATARSASAPARSNSSFFPAKTSQEGQPPFPDYSDKRFDYVSLNGQSNTEEKQGCPCPCSVM